MTTSHIIQMGELKRNLSFLILGQKGGRNRMEIIELLRDRPYNINQMASKLELNYRTVKHHIDILLKYQLISSSKTGGYGDVFFLSPDLEGNLHVYDGIVQKLDKVRKLTDFTDSPLFFRNVLQNTYEGVIILDNEWDIFFWNQSAQRIFGYTNEEVLHGPLNFFFDEMSLNRIRENRMKKKRLNDQEFFGSNKSGERRDINITMNQIYDNDKEIIGSFMLIRDITERKRNEEALKNAENEILQQKEMAILGQMASGVGHELFDPLTSLKNAAYFLEIALEGADPDIRETVGIIKSETARSEMIIKTLLDFSRTGPTNPRMIDVNASIRNVLSGMDIPGTIKISNRLARTMPEIYADPDHLKVVLSNIILNAVQAMPAEGTLTVGSRANGSDSIIICVKDTGSGIPEENLNRVFDPLFTTKPKGIGLGLAIAKKLVEANAGSIEVHNEEEAGFTVTITIPAGAKEVSP